MFGLSLTRHRPARPRAHVSREPLAGDMPNWLRREKPREADVVQIDFGIRNDGLETYKPKPRVPDKEPQGNVEAARTMLRIMTYGEFMEFAAGAGCDPARLWRYATEHASGHG